MMNTVLSKNKIDFSYLDPWMYSGRIYRVVKSKPCDVVFHKMIASWTNNIDSFDAFKLDPTEKYVFLIAETEDNYGFNLNAQKYYSLSFIANKYYQTLKYLEYIIYKLRKRHIKNPTNMHNYITTGGMDFPVEQLLMPYAGDNIRVFNFEGALRGMRNPKNSWHLSDSMFGIAEWDTAYNCAKEVAYSWAYHVEPYDEEMRPVIANNYLEWLSNNHRIHVDEDYVEFACIGPKDMRLAKALINGGSEHRKFLRQIMVTVDITAPLYWWKEFDTYKVGTTANSTSTMHKLTSKPITIDCFEIDDYDDSLTLEHRPYGTDIGIIVDDLIDDLEALRQKYLETNDKAYWKELVRWLPESWLQTRTVTMNYENLLSMVHQRKHHKLVEWSSDTDTYHHPSFIKFARSLPYADDFIFVNED